MATSLRPTTAFKPSANRQFLSQLPFRLLDFSNPADKATHDTLAKLVETMLSTKASLAEAQTDKDQNYYKAKCAGLDRQIDELVYELYGLTAEEIKIVEGAQK